MNTVRGREYDREEEEGGMKWGETEKKKAQESEPILLRLQWN